VTSEGCRGSSGKPAIINQITRISLKVHLPMLDEVHDYKLFCLFNRIDDTVPINDQLTVSPPLRFLYGKSEFWKCFKKIDPVENFYSTFDRNIFQVFEGYIGEEKLKSLLHAGAVAPAPPRAYEVFPP